MTLVSLDAIVQADATLIVGIVFITTLKQGLRQEVPRRDLRLVAIAICLYVFSAVAAIFPDLFSDSFHLLSLPVRNPAVIDIMNWACSTASLVIFYFGLCATALAVYRMIRRGDTSEGRAETR